MRLSGPNAFEISFTFFESTDQQSASDSMPSTQYSVLGRYVAVTGAFFVSPTSNLPSRRACSPGPDQKPIQARILLRFICFPARRSWICWWPIY